MDTLAQKWGSKLVGNLTLKDLQGREIYKLAWKFGGDSKAVVFSCNNKKPICTKEEDHNESTWIVYVMVFFKFMLQLLNLKLCIFQILNW